MAAARNGVSGSLVIHGEPGIGKSAVLDAATRSWSDVQVVRIDGFQAEASMPWSGLQRLFIAIARYAERLPVRLQQALQVASGLEAGPPPDRFQVGMGLLALLGEAGQAQPIVCVVDDAHLLDPESLGVLAFVGRRLRAESVVLLLALRDEPELAEQVAGLPTLELAGLDPTSATTLLSASLGSPIEPRAARAIAFATGGNPLALLDLAEELSVRQLTELSLPEEPVPVGRHLEAHYARQARATQPPVQTWLLLAAAESTGDPDLVAQAAADLGLGPDVVAAAERTGLVELGRTVTFRHPLVRSAVYGSALATDRRRVHRALAVAADSRSWPELAAWHAAKATFGTDEAVAARVEEVADASGRRGGHTSRATLLARAADLTPEAPLRTARLLSAAEAAEMGGSAQLAIALLQRIDAEQLDPVQSGRYLTTRASIGLLTGDPVVLKTAVRDLLTAADHFHGVSGDLEQGALLRAFGFWMSLEWMTEGVTPAQLGDRLRAGADVQEGPRAVALRALSALILRTYAEAVPLLRQAIAMVGSRSDAELLQLVDYGFLCIAFTTALWEAPGGEAAVLRVARIARDAGMLHLLDSALVVLVTYQAARGDQTAAAGYLEQLRELRQAAGYDPEQVVSPGHLAWIGAPRDSVEAVIETFAESRLGGQCTAGVVALGIRDIAEGHYRDAYSRILPIVERPSLHATLHVHVDFVEAAERAGHHAEAVATAEQLADFAAVNGSPWLLGVATRCAALLAIPEEAEALYLRAIDLLQGDTAPADLGRAHLQYGEWLRRAKRRREARDQLRAALAIFERINARAFVDRARNEIEATGEHVTRAPVGARAGLTPQESIIADLAAAGHTNAEIAGTLFISVNTVDYHLRKVFQKPEISSRRALRHRLDGRSPGDGRGPRAPVRAHVDRI